MSMRRKFTIGRDPACDIPLADDAVSSRHAELEFLQDGKLMLTDCRSTNGTFLLDAGGQARRISQSLVSPLDQIRLGGVTMAIRDVLEALRLKSAIPLPVAHGATPREPEAPRVKGHHLLRCPCGGIKAANAPCPECGR
jgi:pSer/pThr/pTyr-binding forkhead associated (FHA) protein